MENSNVPFQTAPGASFQPPSTSGFRRKFGKFFTSQTLPYTAPILFMALFAAIGVNFLISGHADTTQSGTTTGILNTITPQRILDTRTTTGNHNAQLGPGQTMTLSVVGTGGIPAAGVSAVLINVTALNETASTGYLTLYQTDSTRSNISTLTYQSGATIANEALVQVGSDGTITIYNSSGNTDVLVDTEGWVSTAASGAGSVTTSVPQRILDTRSTTGGHKAPLTNAQTISVPVEGVGDIPGTGVSAVLADVIAVPVGNANGYVSAYSSGTTSPPGTSNVTFAAGQTVSTMSLIPVGADGAINVYSGSPNVNVVVDVMGWVSGGDPTTDAGLQAVQPTRILDTRTTTGNQQGALTGGETVNVPVLGQGGIPTSGVAAVAVHVTGVNPTASTYFQAFASGYTENNHFTTTGSLLNIPAKGTVSNTIIVPVGANGDISIYNNTSNPNLVVDIEGWVALPNLNVTPPLSTAFSGTPLTTSDGKRAISILDNANRYAVTTWWNTVAPGLLSTPMTNAATQTPDTIRRLSVEAYSLATAITTNTYDPSYTGVSTATATADAVNIINTVAAGHMVNKPGGWGATSQSEFFAAYLGTAAWMLWSQLPAQTQQNVARVVYSEADWGAGFPMEYYANAAGTVTSPGNSGSDQDSWMPMAAQLAAVMMPTNPHVAMWNYTTTRDALVAWAQPVDVASTTSVNGATLAAWIGGGSNVLANGSVINHNRIAYDYSTLIYQNMQNILVDAMAGASTPNATTALLKPLYNAYATVKYGSPPYDAPGGTTYTPGSATIYYPQGNDWGTGQEIPYALIDAESAAFGVGSTTSATYENLHANAELALQNAHSDGHTYDTNTQYNYVGREEAVAGQAAQLFYTKWVAAHNLAQFNNNTYWMAKN